MLIPVSKIKVQTTLLVGAFEGLIFGDYPFENGRKENEYKITEKELMANPLLSIE